MHRQIYSGEYMSSSAGTTRDEVSVSQSRDVIHTDQAAAGASAAVAAPHASISPDRPFLPSLVERRATGMGISRDELRLEPVSPTSPSSMSPKPTRAALIVAGSPAAGGSPAALVPRRPPPVPRAKRGDASVIWGSPPSARKPPAKSTIYQPAHRSHS